MCRNRESRSGALENPVGSSHDTGSLENLQCSERSSRRDLGWFASKLVPFFCPDCTSTKHRYQARSKIHAHMCIYGERGRSGERDIDLLFHPFVRSVVDSYTRPDR